jgi:hypothetical protein
MYLYSYLYGSDIVCEPALTSVSLCFTTPHEYIHTYIHTYIRTYMNQRTAEKYSADCARQMLALRSKYPSSFWADPDLFFSDGPLVNLGTDFGLMPSLFEPSGIVQQEFFVAGTPVVAFLTGGLKDTVFEFNHNTRRGNGFTFQVCTLCSCVQCMYVCMYVLNTYGFMCVCMFVCMCVCMRVFMYACIYVCTIRAHMPCVQCM